MTTGLSSKGSTTLLVRNLPGAFDTRVASADRSHPCVAGESCTEADVNTGLATGTCNPLIGAHLHSGATYANGPASVIFCMGPGLPTHAEVGGPSFETCPPTVTHLGKTKKHASSSSTNHSSSSNNSVSYTYSYTYSYSYSYDGPVERHDCRTDHPGPSDGCYCNNPLEAKDKRDLYCTWQGPDPDIDCKVYQHDGWGYCKPACCSTPANPWDLAGHYNLNVVQATTPRCPTDYCSVADGGPTTSAAEFGGLMQDCHDDPPNCLVYLNFHTNYSLAQTEGLGLTSGQLKPKPCVD
mmetsp:Transcript_26881/g.68427  ORF Transcript_26881/g.68427 Transcript_26881/m.68427 type:complete len:295 (+) Transcript_26881:260-1144(+)